MSIGIFPSWIIAAAIATWLGGLPGDLSIAGAAIGIAASLGFASRSSKAIAPGFIPMSTLLMRYVFVPRLSTGVPLPHDWALEFIRWTVTPAGLVTVSLLSIVASLLLGLRWMYSGQA